MSDLCRILQGDCLEVLRTLPDESIHCCVTSPPYWGLRDYGVAGQLGLEPTPQEYVAKMVEVFREVRRVLRGDGTLWLNLGDSYAGSGPSGASYQSKTTLERNGKTHDGNFAISKTLSQRGLTYAEKKPVAPPGLKPKDLVGIPWRVAFALQADGWYLRSDVIWHKPNPMPESVTDRPTKAHEYLFLMSKSERYWYDAEAIREDNSPTSAGDRKAFRGNGIYTNNRSFQNSAAGKVSEVPGMAKEWNGRNKRSVWTVPTAPFKEAHFATFPPDLIKPCVLAGCPVGGTVLDPFGGSGTTGMVALELGRKAILIELNPEYVKLADRRCDVTAGLAL